jgi:hypothetical protein
MALPMPSQSLVIVNSPVAPFTAPGHDGQQAAGIANPQVQGHVEVRAFFQYLSPDGVQTWKIMYAEGPAIRTGMALMLRDDGVDLSWKASVGAVSKMEKYWVTFTLLPKGYCMVPRLRAKLGIVQATRHAILKPFLHDIQPPAIEPLHQSIRRKECKPHSPIPDFSPL